MDCEPLVAGGLKMTRVHGVCDSLRLFSFEKFLFCFVLSESVDDVLRPGPTEQNE